MELGSISDGKLECDSPNIVAEMGCSHRESIDESACKYIGHHLSLTFNWDDASLLK